MNMKSRGTMAVLVALPLLVGGLLLAGRLSAGESHRAKAERFAEKMGYMDRIRDMMRQDIESKQRGKARKVEEILAKVDFKPLFVVVVDQVESKVDEATLDELLPYLETPEGTRHLKLLRASGSLQGMEMLLAFASATGSGEMRRLDTSFKAAMEKAMAGVPELNLPVNESAAISTLRNLTSCQAMIQVSGKIDCDNDGIGEFGTFLELTGTVPVRKSYTTGSGSFESWSDFSRTGSPVSPAIMSPSLAGVDENGVVVKHGYCFRIFLPDNASPSGFTSEKGPADKASLAGGTGRVSVDLSEQIWCAYAWPVEKGVTGSRVFFVNQAGDVIQSANEVAKWSGPTRGPDGKSAFRATSAGGITGRIAIGVAGADGDVWKVTN